MQQQPYRYLISYRSKKDGLDVSGHFHIQRSHPFTSDALGSVMEFIRLEVGLDQDPSIMGVFAFADSADGGSQATSA